MENLDMAKKKKQTKQNLNIQISTFPLPYLLEFYSMKLHRSTCAALNGHINLDILGVLEEIKPGSVQRLTPLKCRVLSH